MSVGINIEVDKIFGSKGSANGQFDFSTGCVVANSKLYVCDRQNHRVQIFDLLGNYEGQFGSYGTGNNNFSLPEGICSDGTCLIIADTGNSRIKIHSYAGGFIREFGSFGSGVAEFQYPTDVTYANSYIYVCDRGNHLIKKFNILGNFSSQFGGIGQDDNKLFFPEGIQTYEDKIIIADSGNKKVKIWSHANVYLNKIDNVDFSYINGISVAENVIIVIDRQGNKMFFYDENYQLISEYTQLISYPNQAFYNEGKLYLTDSNNNRVIIFDFLVTQEVPVFADLLLRLKKQLYPTGRAWIMPKSGIFEKVNKALAYSESRIYSAVLNVLNSVLPDNNNFSEQDAINYERVYWITVSENTSLEDRKKAIIRKMTHPGNIPARQSYLHLQNQLQEAGFDVYIHEYITNQNNPIPAISGMFKGGQTTHGNLGILNYDIIANYNNKNRDANFVTSNLYSTFFVGGETFPSRANCESSREKELRNLILKIKPANTYGFMLVDYI